MAKTTGGVRILAVLKKAGIPVSADMIRYALAEIGHDYQRPYIATVLGALCAVGQAERVARGLYQILTLPTGAEVKVAENAQVIARAGGSKNVRSRTIALAGGSKLEKIILSLIYERGAVMYEEIAAKCVREGFVPALVNIQLWALKTRKLIQNPGRGMWTV